MSTTTRSPVHSRWSVLATACLIGGAMSVVAAVNGRAFLAVAMPLIVIGYALAVTVLGRRSDIAAQLGGREDDERRRLINLKATAASGGVMVIATLVGCLVQLARGDVGGPFTWLAAAGGVSYMAAAAYYTRRG
ncbi:hypothetical protein [Yinghuangia sp. YIM S09857]|uniref:hypothetical protein n=1 Tax=Yinghuangia sp. YIM S09857 TaxID=3436929 RepID=UPI003F52E47F